MSHTEESVFAEALEIRDPLEQAAFLDRACANDPKLRASVEALLSAYEEGQFLESPEATLAETVDQAVAREVPGTVIGPYKLLEQIGQGGFGVVFMAEQQQPVRRKVALKVLKPGMDTHQVIARFEAERQALALMNHPSIAHVFDGGATDSGRPFFVMELVRGPSLTDYCDQNNLPICERLELFIDVCQAVQHAHQKGIIHRDVKPSNVLVTPNDGKPVVKVIDFGVAKALGQQLTDKTLFTNFAQMIGTPLYMSPEQAEWSGLDVDTRSDIYSLGVLLYELLTGTTPFDKERLKQASFDEIRRIIREEEPPKPSTRISTLGPAAATLSTQRKSDPKRLSQLCHGELDWIVMKALEKDRNRRYDTASAFAADVQRYLHDEPVLACPPSAGYRLRKLLRRNKPALAIAALVLFFIVSLGAGVGWSLRDRAARQAETKHAVTAALTHAAGYLAEGNGQTDDPDRWQATLRLAQSTVERAEQLRSTGTATEELADQVQQLRQAVDAALADSLLRVELDNLRVERELLFAKSANWQFALARYKDVLERCGVDLTKPEQTATRVRASRLREVLLAVLDDWWFMSEDAAEQQRLEKVLDTAEPPANAWTKSWRVARRRRDGASLAKLAEDANVQNLPASTVANLARDLWHAEQIATAERLLHIAVERYPDNFWLHFNLGSCLVQQGPARAEEALGHLTAARALRKNMPGPYVDMGLALRAKGDLKAAIRLLHAALQVEPNYIPAHVDLGVCLVEQGDLDAGIRSYLAALAIDPKSVEALVDLGNALKDKGDLDGAIRHYETALEVLPGSAHILHLLGEAWHDKHDPERATKFFSRVITMDEGRKSAPAHYNLGLALYDLKDLDGAIREYRAALAIDDKFALAHLNLGVALSDLKDVAAAIPEYRQALAIDDQNAPAHNSLGFALLTQGDVKGAISHFRRALEINPKNKLACVNLGLALEAQGDLDAAIDSYRVALKIDAGFYRAHWALGSALLKKGRFADARTATALGIKHLPPGDPHQDDLKRDLRLCEELIDREKKLSAVMRGEAKPRDPAEAAALASLAQQPYKQLHVTAVRLYREAFADPKLADPRTGYRYNAACSAALAGCGVGNDAEKPDDAERARLRGQALDWLRAELAAWDKVLGEHETKDRQLARRELAHWLEDMDLARVRGEALAMLPPAEQQPWHDLWADVDKTLAEAQEKPAAGEMSKKRP
jgi:tetratricopeptide (TPR) repeat protein/serine/threonine protein kinase